VGKRKQTPTTGEEKKKTVQINFQREQTDSTKRRTWEIEKIICDENKLGNHARYRVRDKAGKKALERPVMGGGQDNCPE